MLLFRLLLLITTLYKTSSKTIQLTPSNFEKSTKGKPIFVKFCSKTCTHCQEMKIAWEVLEEEWEDNEDAIIGTVDCDVHSDFCHDDYNIVGTPTLFYGDRNSLREYAGDLSFSKLNTWAKKVLVPYCSPDNLDPCNDVDKERIISWVASSVEDVEQMIKKVELDEENAEIDFDAGMAKLQVIYDDMNNAHVLEMAKRKKELEILKSINSMRA